ncbi:MAG TPA: dephospho-CoA kinase [bacterium]
MKCVKRKIVGIGGTIGSGKTTAARYLERWGASCVSADRLGKQILPLIAPALKKAFGPSVMKGNRISVPLMRKAAFNSLKNTRLLNRISHPALVSRLRTRIRRFKSGILVIDAALLFGWKDVLRDLDYMILVSAPTHLKERRSLAKGIDKDTFWHIINVQKKERDMAKYADFIIRNTGTIADLKKQCRKIYQEIQHGC